jgi:predicted CopG family antitoxin
MHKIKYKTIVVSEENYLTLKKLGRTADSFNDVLSKILKGELTK